MRTKRISTLCRWAGVAVLLALTGCAAYPTEPVGYATGYYDGPIYDGLYGYDDFGFGGYGYGYHRDHGYHAGSDHHGYAPHGGVPQPHVAWHGAPGGLGYGAGGLNGGFARAGGFGHGGHARG